MNTRTQKVARTLVAGAAGVVAAASLAMPAQAAPIIQPIATNPPITTTPTVKPPVVIQLPVIIPADLRLESFDVTSLAGGWWKLKATLRNGSTSPKDLRLTYPGGGWLIISRTSGGTNPVPPPADPFSVVPDTGQVLKKVAIPSLAGGQAITIEVTTKGRAIFTAAAIPDPPVIDGPTPTLPEANKANNSATVNKLIPLSLTINSALLETFLGSVVDQFQVHLHKTGSFVKLPGFFNMTFGIPQASMDLPWPLGTAYWYVNDINLSDTSIGIADKSLALSFTFETGGDEIVGWVDGGPDWLAPNANVSPLVVNVKLPLQYNAWAQFFTYNSPQVSVNAHWSLNGPLPDSLLPDINGQIADRIKTLLSDDMVRAQIEFELNRQIRVQLLKGGRILSAAINSSSVQMNVEIGG